MIAVMAIRFYYWQIDNSKSINMIINISGDNSTVNV